MSEKEWWAAASEAAAYRHKVRESLFGDCSGLSDLMAAGGQASRNGVAAPAFPSGVVNSGPAKRCAYANSNRWIEWD